MAALASRRACPTSAPTAVARTSVPAVRSPAVFKRSLVQAPRVVLTRADPSENSTSGATVTATSSYDQGAGLFELNKDTFYDYLKQEADKLVIVDFYTDWCGPCKIMYPQLVKLQEEMPHIRIVKFNCNKANKDLGVQLKIRVAPTFHLYRNNEKVAEMTGAKLEKLVGLINEQLAKDA